MDYLDFNLEIGQGGPETYPVSVDSPGGQAEQEMHFPFGDSELENKLLALENALLRSGGSHRGISPQEQTVRDFGERLFKAILTGDVKTRYEVSLREARRQNKGLRLKLRIQPPKLALLPWEFLYDPDGGDYLCFSASTPLVRYVDLRRPVEQLPITPPLRILGMVASPTDLPQLDVDKEKRLVEESIKFLRAKGLVELTWLEEQTWSALQEAMWGGPWHIFHFVGHGDFDRNNGEGRVAFSDEAGRQVVLPARNLARLLDDHRDLRLAFLNSCEGARGSEGDPFSGTAATLVRRGIPAVVAMQYQITDKAAIEFCSAFYESLADALPVDAAVTEARVAVSMDSVLEWGTPVLYMRSRDGRLFDISTEKRPSEQPLGITDQEEHHEYQERTAREKVRKEQLDTLYAQARRSHQNQDWHAVVDVFEQISEVDQDYPDSEGLLESTLEAMMRERKERDALRRYREAVKSTSKEGLNEGRAQSLRDLAKKLELSASAASRIEQEVMDNTKEAILERLEGLYDEARQLHQNREWQAAIDIFARIYLEDANYPDPEGLLASAHEALEKASKEEESLRQYREGVESAWADGELDSREVERLRDLADKLDLSPSHTGEIERTVTGDTKEAILERQERAAKEQYRSVVEDAWADNHVSDTETEQLGALARELDLSMDTVVDIERDVMGDTKEAILERQEQAAREKERLDELYARALRSHQDQDWQKVVDLFEQISAEDPAYPDRERVLASAREALEALKQEQRVAAIYAEGLRHMDAREWQQALECFEEVLLLEPGYRDVGTQLSQARAELSRLQPLTADRIQCVRMLTEHKKAVNAVAFSPDGQLLASCSGGVWRSDDTVRLWRVENGELLHALKGHKSVVTSVAFSPSGELLASGSGDGTVRLWRVQNGELLHILDGHRGSVESVAFSPGGELLASGSGDRMVRLWRVEGGELLRTLEGHTNVVASVAFSPGGELLASGSKDKTVRLWRVEGGELLRTLEGHTGLLRTLEGTLEGYGGSVESVAFSPGGELLASGSGDRMVRLWRVEKGEYLYTLEGHRGWVESVAFSPGGKLT